MTDLAPERLTDTNTSGTGPTPAGALLTDDQVRWLRFAVIVMTALLIAGIVAVIGRVIYLARGAGAQASSSVAGFAIQPALQQDAHLSLPPGAQIKSISLSGSRLAVHHSRPGLADAISVIDLSTGQVISRLDATPAR